MKVHFSLKKQLKPILTTGVPRILEGHLYTQCGNSIVVTNIQTFKIVKEIVFDSIRCFDLRDNYLVVCSTSITIFDLSAGKITETIQLSRVDACAVLIDSLVAGEKDADEFSVIVGRADGSVSKVDLVSKALVWSYKMMNSVTQLKRFGDVVCSTDGSEFWIYRRGELIKHEQPSVVGIVFNGHNIYTLTEEGILTRWERVPVRIPLGIRCGSAMGDDDLLYVASGKFVYTYSYEGALKYVKSILDKGKNLVASSGGNRGKSDLGKDEMSLEDESEVNSEFSARRVEGKEVEASKGSNDAYEDSCWDNESDSDSMHPKKKEKKDICDMRSLDDSELMEIEDEVVIESISKDVISTTEQEIFLMGNDFEVSTVIIGNNDEITDLKQWDDVLFVATNSGRLRYTFINEYGEGEYAFAGHLVPAHDEAIMSLSIYNNFLMTTSRDKRTILWRIDCQDRSDCDEKLGISLERSLEGADGTSLRTVMKKESRISLRRIKTLDSTLDGQNFCALGSSIFVMVGSDQILQIWDYKENIFMEKIHNKEINSVEINEERKLIATSSQDKTAKILDFQGRMLHVLSGHTKGVWSTCFGKNIAATCSADNTVKLWTMDSFTCVGTLIGHRSAVLKGSFYMNDDLLVTGCVTGEMKIWNVKKRTCELNVDVHSDKIWAFITTPKLVTSGNGSIAFFEDESAKKASEELMVENERAKQSIELEGCLRNNLNVKAVEILSKTGDHKMLFKTLVRCYKDKPSEIFDMFEDKQKMLFEVILKQGTFKNSAVVHWLLMEALKRKWKAGGDIMDKIYNLVSKHSSSVDEIYSDLLGFTIFEKSI